MTPLEKFVTTLRTAFRAAVEKTDEDGEELKTASDQLAVINEQLDGVQKLFEEEPATPPSPPAPLEKTMKCAKCGEPVAKAEGDPSEDVKKELSPAALAMLEKAETDAAESRERIEKLEAENEHREAVVLAKTMLGAIPGDHEAFAEVVKALIAEERATLEGVLKAANAVIAKNAKLEKEIGANAPPGPDTPKGQIEAAAAEVRKAFPKLSQPEAVAKALEDNPALYELTLAK